MSEEPKPKRVRKTVNTSQKKYPLQKKSSKLDTSEEIEAAFYDALNKEELQKSINYWAKLNSGEAVKLRDMELLGSIITEYLDGFVLFGYNLEGERILIQKFSTPKDKDAVLEFLKHIFFQTMSNQAEEL